MHAYRLAKEHVSTHDTDDDGEDHAKPVLLIFFSVKTEE